MINISDHETASRKDQDHGLTLCSVDAVSLDSQSQSAEPLYATVHIDDGVMSYLLSHDLQHSQICS